MITQLANINIFIYAPKRLILAPIMILSSYVSKTSFYEKQWIVCTVEKSPK